MQFLQHISAFPFTGGITWRGRHSLYLSVMPRGRSHTLKMIYGKEKAGITVRVREESDEKERARVFWE